MSCELSSEEGSQLQDDSNQKADSFHECSTENSEEKYKKETKYLYEIIRDIAKHNADTFKDDLDIENICLKVVTNEAIDAVAKSSIKSIFVLSGSISKIGSPDLLASLLSHELAHITQDHDNAFIHPKLRENKRYVHIIEDLVRLEKKENVSSEDSEVISLLTEKNEIESTALGQYAAEEVANWKENEADEIGLRFFTNTGYGSESFRMFFEVLQENYSGKECTDKDVIRGTEHHPSICWRRNHVITESERYDYPKTGKKIPDGTTIDQWNEIKRSLRQP